MRMMRRALLVVAVLGLAGVGAEAQVPEKFTNLRVLPKDTPRAELVRTMRRWTGALGVRCGHCYTGGNPETLEGVDFASDAKWEKRAARAMLRMTRKLNDDTLARLEPRPGERAASVERVRVECVTCHRGVLRPRTMETLLLESLAKDGPDAAVRSFRELREQHLERGSYDFSQVPLNAVVESLLAEGRGREALPLADLDAERNPEAPWVQFLLGEVRLAVGDRDGARQAFARSLELAPGNVLARKRMEELEAGVQRP